MAVSMNSVIGFHPLTSASALVSCSEVHFAARGNQRVTLKSTGKARYQLLTTANSKELPLKTTFVSSASSMIGSRKFQNGKRSKFYLLVAEGDQVSISTNENDSETMEESYSSNGSSKNPAFVNSSATEEEARPVDKPGLTDQIFEDSKSSIGSKNLNLDTSESKSNSTVKGSPLTARERLRAARVLSRYTEPKPPKLGLGSKLLEALQESDKGKKRPGLPQAPTNMLDDSKRGLPKGDWTINIIPGGMDVFLIIFSFVFISSVMFATTYIVWKVGAIHFNEY
ncbi:uncharacterized protein [Primulina eburnea]|uniref:uncharacterized protein isoform X2 n=1 Tax=Primulina eburnea TaxID=1245227 RepID=UPI003C6CBF92